MTNSRAGPDDGTSDPDESKLFDFEDDDYGSWIRIEWVGDDYEDAWFDADADDVIDLEENR